VFGAIEERLAAHAFAAAASVSVIIAIVLIFFMSAVYRPAVALRARRCIRGELCAAWCLGVGKQAEVVAVLEREGR